METYNFKKNAHQYLGILRKILDDGVNMGMDLSPIISKLESVTKSIDDGIIRIVLSSNPQPPSKNEIELKEKEATQKKRLKEVKIATRRHKIPLPHNAT